MPLLHCRATFECDICRKPFSVEMHSPSTFDVYDAAVDAVRGSVNYEGPRTSNDLPGLSSVEEVGDGEICLCLCGFCTHGR